MREIQPAVLCFRQLPYHLASNLFALFLFFSFLVSLSLSPSLSLALSLSLPLCRFVANFFRTMSYVWRVYLAITFSDNLAKTIYCRPSHRAISITLERTWKDMSAKMRGTCLQMEGKMKGSEYTLELKMKGTWKEINNYKWKEHERKNERKWMQNERKMHAKWKGHEGRCMQINAKLKEREVLPKHLKPTKQLLDPFPSLFRNGFWLHVGSRTCWFPQNPGKR